MTVILNIETSAATCSVALAYDGILTDIIESSEPNVHSSSLEVFIETLLSKLPMGAKSLDAVAVSEGPGSYTGLRIGFSAAKGLCYALDIPLLVIPTLQSVAAGIKSETTDHDTVFFPMADARRMEVYAAVYDHDLSEIKPAYAAVADINLAEILPAGKKIICGGDGMIKCKALLENIPGLMFSKVITPSAGFMTALSYDKFLKGNFADTAYAVPFYLKDFNAAAPKVKGLYT